MRNEIPDWLGPALAAARHQDELVAKPWWFRLLHHVLTWRRCEACMYWRKECK